MRHADHLGPPNVSHLCRATEACELHSITQLEENDIVKGDAMCYTQSKSVYVCVCVCADVCVCMYVCVYVCMPVGWRDGGMEGWREGYIRVEGCSQARIQDSEGGGGSYIQKGRFRTGISGADPNCCRVLGKSTSNNKLQTAVGGGGGSDHPQKTCIRA